MRRRKFRIKDVAHLGGIARREKLTPAERSAVAKRAADARMDRITPARRSEIARRANEIRWMRVRQAQRAKEGQARRGEAMP